MAVIYTVEDNPELDGLGKSTALGHGFIRRINVDLNGAALVATITPDMLGAVQLIRTISIVPKSLDSIYESSAAPDEVEYTASANTTVFDAFILCRGL